MPKAPTSTKNSKKQHDNTKSPPKTSIARRLRTDLGGSVGVSTATQLVWLNRFTESQPSNFPFTASFTLRIVGIITFFKQSMGFKNDTSLCQSLSILWDYQVKQGLRDITARLRQPLEVGIRMVHVL